MSAPARRKVKPAPKGPVTFTIVVEDQKMVVDYQRNWTATTGLFEFRSPHNPPQRIPISESGYRRHIARVRDVEASSPQDYAREFVLAVATGRTKRLSRRNDRDRPRLF
jgi:hypothetical protein